MILEDIQKELWEYLEKTRENAEKSLARLNPNFSTGREWLEFAGTWLGDDLGEVFPATRNSTQKNQNRKKDQ